MMLHVLHVLKDKEKNGENMIGPHDIRKLYFKTTDRDSRSGVTVDLDADVGGGGGGTSGENYYPDLPSLSSASSVGTPARVLRQTSVV